MVGIEIPYGPRVLRARVPRSAFAGYLSPNEVAPVPDPESEIRRALARPIAADLLTRLAAGKRNAVILADDLTRQTPVDLMIPCILDALNAAGMPDSHITVLIALGTHRPMTEAEIASRFTSRVLARVAVVNHAWQNPQEMVHLGTSDNGTPIILNRLALSADLVIGLGSIVPHHIPGFSGGAKIVQPGISGAETTGATHYFSTRTRRSYLGIVENPVRAEMESIGEKVGLTAILNVVLDRNGSLVEAFCGDPRLAFRAGVERSRQVYGVPASEKADIVIASSHPCDLEFWQAHKALYPADMLVKPGGVIVLATPCPEGVSVSHTTMLDYTALSPEDITAAIEAGRIDNVVAGALALAWSRIRQRSTICLVSDGIDTKSAAALGFQSAPSLQSSIDAALKQVGPQPRLLAMTHAPETLPLLP